MDEVTLNFRKWRLFEEYCDCISMSFEMVLDGIIEPLVIYYGDNYSDLATKIPITDHYHDCTNC